jgi:hypothetical protein
MKRHKRNPVRTRKKDLKLLLTGLVMSVQDQAGLHPVMLMTAVMAETSVQAPAPATPAIQKVQAVPVIRAMAAAAAQRAAAAALAEQVREGLIPAAQAPVAQTVAAQPAID